jgi:hypothetical protein
MNQGRLVGNEGFGSAKPDTRNGSHTGRLVLSEVEVSRSVFPTVKKLN